MDATSATNFEFFLQKFTNLGFPGSWYLIWFYGFIVYFPISLVFCSVSSLLTIKTIGQESKGFQIPWGCLKESGTYHNLKPVTTAVARNKIFAQVLHNTCDIPSLSCLNCALKGT